MEYRWIICVGSSAQQKDEKESWCYITKEKYMLIEF